MTIYGSTLIHKTKISQNREETPNIKSTNFQDTSSYYKNVWKEEEGEEEKKANHEEPKKKQHQNDNERKNVETKPQQEEKTTKGVNNTLNSEKNKR